MGVEDGDVLEEETSEVEPAGAAELDGAGLGPNPAVGGGEVEHRPGGGLGADGVVAGVDVAPGDCRVVRVLHVDAVVVGGIEVPEDRHLPDRRVVAAHQVQAARSTGSLRKKKKEKIRLFDGMRTTSRRGRQGGCSRSERCGSGGSQGGGGGTRRRGRPPSSSS